MVETSMSFVQVPYTLYQRNQQACIGFFHLASLFFVSPFMALSNFLLLSYLQLFVIAVSYT